MKYRNVHVATNATNTLEVMAYDAEKQTVKLGSRYGAEFEFRLGQLRANQYQIIPAVECSVEGIAAVIYKTLDGKRLP